MHRKSQTCSMLHRATKAINVLHFQLSKKDYIIISSKGYIIEYC